MEENKKLKQGKIEENKLGPEENQREHKKSWSEVVQADQFSEWATSARKKREPRLY